MKRVQWIYATEESVYILRFLGISLNYIGDLEIYTSQKHAVEETSLFISAQSRKIERCIISPRMGKHRFHVKPQREVRPSGGVIRLI